MLTLIRLFLIEEIRLRRSFSSSLSLIIFPEILLIGALSGYIYSPLLMEEMTYSDIHLAVLSGLFVFGISMGGMAFLGKEFIERSLGPVTMLAASSSYQPVSQKKVFLAYYLHDLIFYVFLVLIPVTLGFGLGLIMRPTGMERFLLITAAQWITFLLGMSLSMLVSSALTNPKRIMLLYIPIAFIPLIAPFAATGDLRTYLPTFLAVEDGSWIPIIITLVLSLTYSSLGTLIFDAGSVRTRSDASGDYSRTYRISKAIYGEDDPRRAVFAREIMNLVRGKAYIRLTFSLLFPLIVITGLVAVVGGIGSSPVDMNMVFFAMMISFFTISIYSNLTNMDYLEFDQTMPVNTVSLVNVKLTVFLIISLPLSLLMLITVSLITGDLTGLLFGIPVVLFMVPYMGHVTAYLTGLWTNSLMFDSSVFLRYLVLTVLPLVMSTMLSFLMDERFLISVIGIAVVVAISAVATLFLRRGLVKRWGRTTLTSAGLDTD